MTTPPSDRRHTPLDADTLLALLDEVNAELPEGSTAEVAAIGGAVLALRWADRLSEDLDVVSDSMSPALRAAAAAVADRHGLMSDWINDAAKISTPNLDPELVVLYRGDRLTVYGAGSRYLLATKLFAARDDDFDDAVRLAQETGITDAEGMLELLSAAYPDWVLTPRNEYIVHLVAEAAQQRATTTLATEADEPSIGPSG